MHGYCRFSDTVILSNLVNQVLLPPISWCWVAFRAQDWSNAPKWEFPKIGDTLFWGPYYKDPTIFRVLY